MCLGEYMPLCIRHSCACISTDVHICSSFVRNFLWGSLIYHLPGKHWRMANKHDRTCTFTFAAKSTLGECICSLVFGQTHLLSVYASLDAYRTTLYTDVNMATLPQPLFVLCINCGYFLDNPCIIITVPGSSKFSKNLIKIS